jgi:hypothetical protein
MKTSGEEIQSLIPFTQEKIVQTLFNNFINDSFKFELENFEITFNEITKITTVICRKELEERYIKSLNFGEILEK